MRIIPEKTKSIVEHHICEHHKTHPQDDGFAGCTCSSSYYTVPLDHEPPHPDKQSALDHKCTICHRLDYSLRSVCPGCGAIGGYVELEPCSDPKPVPSKQSEGELLKVWELRVDRSRYLFWNKDDADNTNANMGAAGGGEVYEAQVLGIAPTIANK